MLLGQSCALLDEGPRFCPGAKHNNQENEINESASHVRKAGVVVMVKYNLMLNVNARYVGTCSHKPSGSQSVGWSLTGSTQIYSGVSECVCVGEPGVWADGGGVQEQET